MDVVPASLFMANSFIPIEQMRYIYLEIFANCSSCLLILIMFLFIFETKKTTMFFIFLSVNYLCGCKNKSIIETVDNKLYTMLQVFSLKQKPGFFYL